MQRNPFTPKNEMGWMNIMELSYCREGGDRKHYHGQYLVAKQTGVLERLGQETRCDIKLRGNDGLHT